jgi:serpin B
MRLTFTSALVICLLSVGAPPIVSVAADPIVDANNQFGLKLYAQLAQQTGNIFFSPYNIWSALTLLYEGARGETEKEMRDVTGAPADPETRRTAIAAIHARLQADGAYKLSVANALWAHTEHPFLPEYVAVARQYYDAGITNLDFIRQLEPSRLTINAWVEKKTNDKIKDLFPLGALSSATRLVLTTAIYFKGQWVREFDKALTKPEPFRSSGRSNDVPMMHAPEAQFRYGEDAHVQVLELPYKGDRLSMLIVLPRGDDPRSVEKALSIQSLAAWRALLRERDVEVFLPKFTFTKSVGLNGVLGRLGMGTAFTSDADFSGLDGTRALSVGSVVHKAFVDVNEEGTEAAAATGIAMLAETVRQVPPIFRADHPFIFAIQETGTGNLLFIGRIANPIE